MQLLHRAARRCSSTIVQFLLDHGAWLDVCDENGRTPLHDGKFSPCLVVEVLPAYCMFLAAACWTSSDNSDVIYKLVEQDSSLVNAVDSFDAVPLDYVPRNPELRRKYYSLFHEHAVRFWGS